MSRHRGRPGWRCSRCPASGHEATEQEDLDEFEKHYRACAANQREHMTTATKEEPS